MFVGSLLVFVGSLLVKIPSLVIKIPRLVMKIPRLVVLKSGTIFAVCSWIAITSKPMTKTSEPMTTTTKIRMMYRYRQEWREKCVTLEQVAQMTREGKYVHRVNAVRDLEEVPTEIGMSSGQIAAEWLPQVHPSMGEGGAYTGLVLLSFRMDSSMEALEQLRTRVNLWPQTLLSFVGTSGRSLKVLIPYRLTGGGLPTSPHEIALFRQYAYRRAADYALNATGIRAEEVVPDGTEHFRISYDPQLYLNPAAAAIEMEQPTEPLTDQTAPIISRPQEVTLDQDVLPGYTRRQMDAMKFNFVCRNMNFELHDEPEVRLMQLATACRKAGIDQELATLLTLKMYDSYEQEELVRTTFNTAYEHHRLGRQNPIEKNMMHQLLLEDFLKRRYMFRRNKVTGDVEYQPKYRYELWWKPLTQEARNDINNAAIREGIKVWPQDLDRILLSNHVSEYDPVREWLDRLPQWDGRDRLGELADRVKTTSPSWRDNFKIWMRSMVNQWLAGTDSMYGAQMVLMLVGGQGTRKSTFMRMLLPRELMIFYIDRIDFANRNEALRALSRFLLINIDEYDQISKAQTAYLKHLIQRTDVKERKLYTTTFEQHQRYAAFCATTNSLAPLKDETGSRRYLVVEVDERIDTNTQGDRAIDYQQLYAQIVSEIRSGEEYAFTGERERQIQEHNADYYEVPTVIALFEDRFRKPRRGDEVVLMSPTEILKQLKVDAGSRSNATLIGGYLHRNGYARGEGSNRRRYQLAYEHNDPS